MHKEKVGRKRIIVISGVVLSILVAVVLICFFLYKPTSPQPETPSYTYSQPIPPGAVSVIVDINHPSNNYDNNFRDIIKQLKIDSNLPDFTTFDLTSFGGSYTANLRNFNDKSNKFEFTIWAPFDLEASFVVSYLDIQGSILSQSEDDVSANIK